jgi:hypothetical protein
MELKQIVIKHPININLIKSLIKNNINFILKNNILNHRINNGISTIAMFADFF